MARIVVGSYMVRYPLGGMMSWVLQYLVGFARLGHDVYFVEKSGYRDACFNPMAGSMSDDCTYGTQTVAALLSRFDLGEKWCFVDYQDQYYGLTRPQIAEIFSSADVFIDMGTHGSWCNDAERCDLRVLIDGEPAFTQLKMLRKGDQDHLRDFYDFYYTTGQNIGTPASTAPTAGRDWRHLFHPVCPELFGTTPAAETAPYTTVMNWQSYEPIEHDGRRYFHKDVEFRKFIALPQQTHAALEVAVSGKVPRDELAAAGWRIRRGHEATISFDSFADYIAGSRGEFSVCKSGYVVSNSGWFSDRSAAYLASGRPVVLQETGFSAHLPTGRGLFAVRTVEEAAAAIDAIESNYQLHARAAREIAADCLDSRKVLGAFLEELGAASTLVAKGVVQ